MQLGELPATLSSTADDLVALSLSMLQKMKNICEQEACNIDNDTKSMMFHTGKVYLIHALVRHKIHQ